jgi:hypothetical protein
MYLGRFASSISPFLLGREVFYQQTIPTDKADYITRRHLAEE